MLSKIRFIFLLNMLTNSAYSIRGRSNQVRLTPLNKVKAPLMVDLDITELIQQLEDTFSERINEQITLLDSRFVDLETRLSDKFTSQGFPKWFQDVIANSTIDLCKFPPGKPGPNGAKGEKGEPGNDGIKGIAGQKGSRGEQGSKGYKDQQGVIGLKEGMGNRGINGIPGIKGQKGDVGFFGVDGVKGEVGLKGKKGNKGETCEKGERVLTKEESNHIFLLVFPNNYKQTIHNQQIFITSLVSNGSCSITSPVYSYSDSFDVTIGNTKVYTYNKSMALTQGYSQKGILLDCNVPVNVIGFSKEAYSSNGFSVLPSRMLGREYIIPAHMPHRKYNSLFGLTTMSHVASITITTKTKGGKIEFDKKSYDTNSTFSITIDRLQSAQIECKSCDLSGTLIKASKPITVVAGADCALVLSTGCSHISEMVIPTTKYSSLFVIPLFPEWFRGLIRLFSHKETYVLVHASNINNLSLHDFTEIKYENTDVIESSSPIMVQVYGNVKGGAGAFMLTIPGINQFKSSYAFHVPDFNFNSSLSFVVRYGDKDYIRLDGSQVTISLERQSTIHGERYTSFSISISPGYHKVKHNKGTPFALFVSGFRVADGYGYLAGNNL